MTGEPSDDYGGQNPEHELAAERGHKIAECPDHLSNKKRYRIDTDFLDANVFSLMCDFTWQQCVDTRARSRSIFLLPY